MTIEQQRIGLAALNAHVDLWIATEVNAGAHTFGAVTRSDDVLSGWQRWLAARTSTGYDAVDSAIRQAQEAGMAILYARECSCFALVHVLDAEGAPIGTVDLPTRAAFDWWVAHVELRAVSDEDGREDYARNYRYPVANNATR